MLTKLPDCPRCGYPDLWRLIGPAIRYRCAECGWDSGVLAMIAHPDVARDLLERAVQDAKVPK